jgi:murein DD-endopeptidase MepM/ murein hydrolase activator NlpD
MQLARRMLVRSTPHRHNRSMRFFLVGLISLCTAFAAQAQSALVSVTAQQQGNNYVLVAKNAGHAPVQVFVSLTESSNLAARPALPLAHVVQPGRSEQLSELSSANGVSGFSFRYRTTWQLGDPKAVHDARAAYRLPFENGKRYIVSQAPGGPLLTHTTASQRDAIDIVMPEGDAVVAARSGVVIENVRPFDTGRMEPYFYDKANVVRILHDDGTWADYAHLLKYSANIVPGQRIEAGVEIGLSGSSGFSGGPHLHFVVQKNDGGKVVSVPVQFTTHTQGVIAPQYRQTLFADYHLDSKSGQDLRKPSATQRTLQSCMKPGTNTVDETVLRCMRGG